MVVVDQYGCTHIIWTIFFSGVLKSLCLFLAFSPCWPGAWCVYHLELAIPLPLWELGGGGHKGLCHHTCLSPGSSLLLTFVI